MPMELDYRANKTTLVVSEDNGAGKSTLSIWALYYALFGKPYGKGVKMASLTNSRSNKDCLVEVEFDTRGSSWKVRRGQKPTIFEIYQDGKLLENEASLKDPQAYLQSQILGFDAKAFCSMIALGVTQFVPFMEMSAQERRTFVEQMLDMVVISGMNSKTKDRLKVIKKQIEQIEYEVGILESKKANHQRTLAILEERKQQRLNESGSELEILAVESGKYAHMDEMCTAKIFELEGKIENLVNERMTKLSTMITRFKGKMEDIQKNSDNISHLQNCPTCKQEVSEDHKQSISEAAANEKNSLKEPLEKLETEYNKLAEVLESNKAIQFSIDRIKTQKIQISSKLSSIQASIKSINTKMKDSGEDSLIEAEKEAITLVWNQLDGKDADLEKLRVKETHHNQLLQILKDDGIKANIVEQYLPALNQSINNTLDKMNLYIQINIDSEFNLSMFAPSRKGQTLENLSTGQLRRVDLAVLLAWREIAKSKASVDCNLLILDEILENLSANGVEEFMEMWHSIGDDINLFVITQRNAEFDQFFDNTIKYKLVDDMTTEAEA